MLRYEYIDKEWIVSPTARRVYRGAARLSFVLFVPMVAVLYYGGIPHLIRPVMRLLLLIGAAGTATTAIGMEYFLFRFDNSHALKQLFWFCAMFFLPIGPALYCFIVYSRSAEFKVTQAGHASEPIR
jgi:hypothetical protein